MIRSAIGERFRRGFWGEILKTKRAIPSVLAAFILVGTTVSVEAQVAIPLQYMQLGESWRMAINVGINGGAPKPYLFDTGSSLFNAAYNPAWWPGFANSPTNRGAPTVAGLPINVKYGYADGGGYTGNIVQVPLLNFFAPGGTTAA